MVTCPGCDAINEDGEESCSRCKAPIGLVCAQCSAGNPSLARFCCGCGGRLEAVSSSGSSLGRPERRQITVMFCDLVGSSAIARRLGPEDWHQLLHNVHSRCGEIVAADRGHVAQYLGDGLLAYFGYPIATEGAPRQAVTVGLRLVREIVAVGKDHGIEMTARVGIHTGSVVVGNVGAKGRQESLALGETPTLAARMQEVAAPGAVVLSAETLRLVEGFFETRDLGERELKGFTGTFQIHEVVHAKGPKSRLEAASPAGLTPMVGREEQWAALVDAWSSALSGRRACLLLIGEPGIGKSRLVHHLSTQLSDQATRIDIRCSEHARSSAFSPLIDALQRAGNIRHGESTGSIRTKLSEQTAPLGLGADAVDGLSSLFGIPIQPSRETSAARLRAGMIEAFVAWLSSSVDRDPRVVIFEDLHWADPSTLEVLTRLIEHTTTRRLLLVLTARPEFVSRWPAEVVRPLSVGRLHASNARTIIEQVAGGSSLPDEVVDQLTARAEGIPLFLEEMTKATLESGGLRRTEAGYVLERGRGRNIPTTLQDSLMGRLDQLGQNKPLAQLAAVLGREFSYPFFQAVWRRLPSVPSNVDLARGLEILVRAQLLTNANDSAETRYEFRHSLLQEAAYQSLLRSTQREYHLHAAHALVEESPARADAEPEVIALHFSAAMQRDRAAHYWSRAGERALGASAYLEAISHYRDALEQLADLSPGATRMQRELDIQCRLGVALITTRGFTPPEVEETYKRALELCGELGDEASYRGLSGIWSVFLVRGDLSNARSMLPRLERLAANEDVEATIMGNTMLGAWYFFRGEYEAAIRHNASGMAAYDVEHPKEQHSALLLKHGFEGLLYPAEFLALCYTMVGDARRARETWAAAAELSVRIGDPYVTAALLAFGALMNHELGELDTAADLAAKARAVSEEKGFVVWSAIGMIISGSARFDPAAPDDSITLIQQGLGILRAIGDRGIYIHYMSYLAKAYLRYGRDAEALEVVDEALGLTRVHIGTFCEPELLRLLAEVHLSCGRTAEARDVLRKALALSRDKAALLHELRIAKTLSELLRSEGDARSALQLLSEARTHFDGSEKFALLDQVDAYLGSLRLDVN